MKLSATLILLGSAMAASAQTPMAALPPAVHARAFGDGDVALMQVSDDEDEDDGWLSFGDDDSSSDDCDPEDVTCPATGSANAAPAGTVAPPANGLFGDGKAPVASTN